MLTKGNPYGDIYPSITELLLMTQQSKNRFNALPQEEQDEINFKREVDNEAKRVSACIQQGLYPKCLGKLIRGKKDKKNDYKRSWNCMKCEKDITH